ncbi:PHP domain-containing protein [Vibrio sp. RC27]
MHLEVDTHTHTIASGHAYSTLIENAKVARENGLKIMCATDHAELMPGAPHPWFFVNQKVLPRFIENVAIIRGVESNIIDETGNIDIQPFMDQNLDWIIASFHEPVFAPNNTKNHTTALLNVIKNGRVDALGHLGNPRFDFDFDEVISCAAEHNVAIELNNSTLLGHSRVGSIDRCYKIGEIAKQYNAFITTGSDAHFCDAIGKLDLAQALINKVGIDSQQVITHRASQFLSFLALRGHQPIDAFSTLG